MSLTRKILLTIGLVTFALLGPTLVVTALGLTGAAPFLVGMLFGYPSGIGVAIVWLS